MIVSHAHRFIFLKTLKTAGTSVEIALSRACGPDDVLAPLSPDDERLRAELGGRPAQNYESPPLPHRATSHLRASKVRQVVGREVWDGYYKFAVERNPWDAVVSLYFWVNRHEDRRGQTFADFLAEDRAETLARRNFQAYHLGGEVAVDRVLAYEDLTAELEDVWSHLGLPGSPELPGAKRGPRAGAGYRDHYTPEQADRVATAFAPVIAERGYRF